MSNYPLQIAMCSTHQ